MALAADYQAIIFDMDGVLTDTRRLHFASWKKTFDDFFKETDLKYRFDESDYNKFVDGKVRSSGIQDYFQSIGIQLTARQIDKLSLTKNTFFQSFINSGSLYSFQEVKKTLISLRDKGIKLGVVSSSENCRLILSTLHLESFFDAILDGSDGKKLKLHGKPDIDYYQVILRTLGVDSHFSALIEDSIAGIQAGKRSSMTVFGMCRENQNLPETLLKAGADYVIKDLGQIDEIPHAIEKWDDLVMKIDGKEPALFLDFDGTISNIVSRPEEATLIPGIKDVLLACSKSLKLAVISGRDRTDVKGRVGIDDIFYAGSHGFDMSGPGCFHYSYDQAEQFLSSLEKFNLTIGSLLFGIQGLILERKKFCTSIHYRLVKEEDVIFLKTRIREIILGYPMLKIRDGKKVLEVLPQVDWGKDKAISKLVEVLNLDLTNYIPVFIGDDTTDEEAFYGLKDNCLCLRVCDVENAKTHAHYHLKNPQEVIMFLSLIKDKYAGASKRWRNGN